MAFIALLIPMRIRQTTLTNTVTCKTSRFVAGKVATNGDAADDL